jgi:chromosome partitioning protein
VNLAVEAERQGLGRVALADTDSPQGSASHWWNARRAETPLFARELDVQSVELLVVDTAPQVAQDRIIRRADFVIIPVRPSPNDLRAVGETLAVVEKFKKPFCFVINGVKPRATITTDTLRVLAQHGKVSPVMLGDRVDYAVSTTNHNNIRLNRSEAPWRWCLPRLGCAITSACSQTQTLRKISATPADDKEQGIEARVQTALASELERQKAALAEAARAEAAKALAVEMQDLRDTLQAKEAKLEEARQTKIALRKRERALEERTKEIELEVARRMDNQQGYPSQSPVFCCCPNQT